MARIFLGLALFSVSLLIANLVLGFRIGDFNRVSREHVKSLRANQAERQAAQRRPDAEAEIQKLETQRDALHAAFTPVKQRKNLHFWTGIVATIVTILVNCITVTYFIGTARWCKEVAETYPLDPAIADRSTTLKHQTFPWALGSFVAMLAVATLGAASDPSGSLKSDTASWVMPHYTMAIMATVVVTISFLVQMSNIGANYEVIDQIVDEVNRIRAEKGLDANVRIAMTNDP